MQVFKELSTLSCNLIELYHTLDVVNVQGNINQSDHKIKYLIAIITHAKDIVCLYFARKSI